MNALSPHLFLILGIACFIGSGAVTAAGYFWARRDDAHQLVRERLTVGFSPAVPLPFAAPASAPFSEPTHPGAFCPDGAAAPKTAPLAGSEFSWLDREFAA